MTHVPLYVGVVDSSVVQVVAERCDHQSQDLQIVQVILWGGGGIEMAGWTWGGGAKYSPEVANRDSQSRQEPQNW